MALCYAYILSIFLWLAAGFTHSTLLFHSVLLCCGFLLLYTDTPANSTSTSKPAYSTGTFTRPKKKTLSVAPNTEDGGTVDSSAPAVYSDSSDSLGNSVSSNGQKLPRNKRAGKAGNSKGEFVTLTSLAPSKGP